MVHTIELYMNLTKRESKVIRDDFQIGNNKFYNFENSINIDGVMMTLKNEYDGIKGVDRIHIFIDCINLLDRAEIVEDDVIIIQSKIKNLIYSILGINKSFYLYRIDYRFDYLVVDKTEREILFINYNKYLRKTSYMKKVDVFNRFSKESNAAFSVRYDNSSKAFNLYDKAEERKARGRKIEEYEKDIIRFEAQVRIRHIRYMKKQYNIEPKLTEYFTKEMYNKYMSEIVGKIIFYGDYYNKYHAFKKIDASSYTEKEKLQLKSFLNRVAISRKLSIAKEELSYYMYKKILKMLFDLNINPVLIPKNYLITYIANPINNMLIL